MFDPNVTQQALQQPALGRHSAGPQQALQVVQLTPHMCQSFLQPAMPCVPAVLSGYAQQMAVPQFALRPDVSRVPSGGLASPQLAPQPDVSRAPSGGLPSPQLAPPPEFALQPDVSRVSSGGLAALAQPAAALQPAVQPLADAPKSGIDMNEVLQAVQSLYRDQLQPYGRILRKRLGERAVEAGRGSADVDACKLEQACEACPWLQVRDGSGGDWSALLRGRADCFVNVYSPEDCYPPELWEAASAYFARLGLDERSMALPGGRYSCAQVLVGRRLPFLAGLSLGQVCHIVQLAISQRKLLGYLGGAVVPYGRSQSMLKERCAERQRPCNLRKTPSSSLATWDMVRAFLRDALSDVGGSGSVPLSNIKRMFRSKFRAELSETSLGHSKLSELLQDPRVADLCALRLQKHKYVVSPLPRPAPASTISLASSLAVWSALQPAAIVVEAPRLQALAGRPTPLSLEEDGEETGELQVSAVEPGGLAPADLLFPPTPDSGTPCWASRGAAPEQPRTVCPLPTLLGRVARALSSGRAAAAKEGAAKPAASVVEGRGEAAHPQPPGTSPGEPDIWTVPLVTPSTLRHIRESLRQNAGVISMPEEQPTAPGGARCRARSAER